LACALSPIAASAGEPFGFTPRGGNGCKLEDLAPLLIMAGALDDNVLPEIQEKLVAAYRAAGGDCQFQIFEGAEHEWVANEGPQTDRTREMVKAFIARQLKT
jgi:acetyl esterase